MNKFLIIFSVFIPFLVEANVKKPPPPGGPPPPPGLPIDQYELLLFIIGVVLILAYRKKIKKII